VGTKVPVLNRAGSGWLRTSVILLTLALVAAACGHSAPAAGGVTNSSIPQPLKAHTSGLGTQQLLADLLPPIPVPPGTKLPGPGSLERKLLAEPLSFASYEEAMRAAYDCDNAHDLPHWSVSNFAVTKLPSSVVSLQVTWGYGYRNPQLAKSGTTLPPPRDGQLPAISDQAQQYALWDSCFMKYAEAMDKRWVSQGSMDAQQLASQRPAFLNCMISAGVEISRSASISQILDTFDSPNWYKPLTPAQYQQASTCMTQYSEFMQSLGPK
jgi:hypothetical protein